MSAETSTPQLKESDLWLAPSSSEGAESSELSRAVATLQMGRAEDALSVFVESSNDPVLGGYARLYQGRAELALARVNEAALSARRVIDRSPGGALGEAALWLLADALESGERWVDAGNALQALIDTGTTDVSRAYLRLGRVAEKRKDLSAARAAYAKVYYEFPLTDSAAEAGQALDRFPSQGKDAEISAELSRAEQLYGGRRYADARKAFADVRAKTTGDSRLLVDLRMAQCDVRTQKYTAARDALKSLLSRTGARQAEAEVAYATALRGLHRDAEYTARVAAFVDANPASPFAEQALDELGTYYILADEDEKAAATFTEIYRRFPQGAFAERAAWKAGWYAYRQSNFRETARLFEAAAAGLVRADTRPSWLYWSARAHERLGEPDAALASYRQAVASYRNSYYGRESAKRIAALTAASGARAGGGSSVPRIPPLTVVAGTPPANTRLIQRLLSVGLYDDAILELRRVQREAGSSPIVEATIAFALNRTGQLRPGITAMRRAYPLFLAEGGEGLPLPLLKIIFPIQHWDLLRRYASDHKLDPYLIAAQVAQESTFQADVRSAANAYGLMQILPSTGRRYATQMGIRGFSTSLLTDPEINVRIGTQYMSELVGMFGAVPPALAAYNAGEHRVVRWNAERVNLEPDEWIDDIPFPETQFYVKRIIGTTDDYRRLYGDRRVASMSGR
jgi:soluble lytic murein transglycosylase